MCHGRWSDKRTRPRGSYCAGTLIWSDGNAIEWYSQRRPLLLLEVRIEGVSHSPSRAKGETRFPGILKSMWPQNGNSDPQVDLDTAAERASKYLSFSYECWFQSVPLSMCTLDDCVSSEAGISTLKRQSRALSVLSRLEFIPLDMTRMARVILRCNCPQ